MKRDDLNLDVPCVAERYSTAIQSSNLRCETREDAPLGSTGILIAAGWSPSRIGASLLRLHTKTDRLGLEQVHSQIMIKANEWGIERPAAIAASVLAWWMRPTCAVCHGVCLEVVAGTPSLSAYNCKECDGTGKVRLGYGENGRRLAEWLENCKDHAVGSIKKRLHTSH